MKTIRCFTVDENGVVTHRGWKYVQFVSDNLDVIPITHVVLWDDLGTGKWAIWPKQNVYYFYNEE